MNTEILYEGLAEILGEMVLEDCMYGQDSMSRLARGVENHVREILKRAGAKIPTNKELVEVAKARYDRLEKRRRVI